MKKNNLFWVAIFLLAFVSCTTVKAYQRVYLNDPLMQVGDNLSTQFDNYATNIREGGITAGTGKSEGGCGCN